MNDRNGEILTNTYLQLLVETHCKIATQSGRRVVLQICIFTLLLFRTRNCFSSSNSLWLLISSKKQTTKKKGKQNTVTSLWLRNNNAPFHQLWLLQVYYTSFPLLFLYTLLSVSLPTPPPSPASCRLSTPPVGAEPLSHHVLLRQAISLSPTAR